MVECSHNIISTMGLGVPQTYTNQSVGLQVVWLYSDPSTVHYVLLLSLSLSLSLSLLLFLAPSSCVPPLPPPISLSISYSLASTLSLFISSHLLAPFPPSFPPFLTIHFCHPLPLSVSVSISCIHLSPCVCSLFSLSVYISPALFMGHFSVLSIVLCCVHILHNCPSGSIFWNVLCSVCLCLSWMPVWAQNNSTLL